MPTPHYAHTQCVPNKTEVDENKHTLLTTQATHRCRENPRQSFLFSTSERTNFGTETRNKHSSCRRNQNQERITKESQAVSLRQDEQITHTHITDSFTSPTSSVCFILGLPVGMRRSCKKFSSLYIRSEDS